MPRRSPPPPQGRPLAVPEAPQDGTAERTVTIPVRAGEIHADLTVPPGAIGTVVFAHGSGSGRTSPRNRYVAAGLQSAGVGTLLLDLLTAQEESVDEVTGEFRFDIPRLADRLVEVVDLVTLWPETRGRPVGLYGASTGGAAALIAAAARGDPVRAVVLRGARTDLAEPQARRVTSPTLFLVGELDPVIRALNEATYAELAGTKELVVVRGASHLFEEPGTLEEVARIARDWFLRFLPSLG